MKVSRTHLQGAGRTLAPGDVVDDRHPLVAVRPDLFDDADPHGCDRCDRTFDSARGLAAHSRVHE